jgi:transcriptional regulator with XRE-family HTH domain
MATFGRHVRKLRKAQGRSLRKVAESIGKTHAYLSQVESGKSPPSEGVVLALADELGEDPDVLMAMAGKLPPGLEEIIRKRPQLFADLIRQLKNVPDKTIKRVTREVKDGNW